MLLRKCGIFFELRKCLESSLDSFSIPCCQVKVLDVLPFGMATRAREILEFLEISHIENRLMHELSTGQTSQVIRGVALLYIQDGLFLDQLVNNIALTWHLNKLNGNFLFHLDINLKMQAVLFIKALLRLHFGTEGRTINHYKFLNLLTSKISRRNRSWNKINFPHKFISCRHLFKRERISQYS